MDRDTKYYDDPHIILGSALGNALASGLTLDEVLQCWYMSENLNEFDAAIAGLGKLRLIQNEKT